MATIIIGLLVAAVLFLAARRLYRDRRKGSPCGGKCSCCSCRSSCCNDFRGNKA